MGLLKFLKLVKCICFFNAKGTASHMTEAEYLKVNLAICLIDFRDVRYKVYSGKLTWNSRPLIRQCRLYFPSRSCFNL